MNSLMILSLIFLLFVSVNFFKIIKSDLPKNKKRTASIVFAVCLIGLIALNIIV